MLHVGHKRAILAAWRWERWSSALLEDYSTPLWHSTIGLRLSILITFWTGRGFGWHRGKTGVSRQPRSCLVATV